MIPPPPPVPLAVASNFPTAGPVCTPLASRVHSFRIHVIRDILVAEHVRVMWAERRLFRDLPFVPGRPFYESGPQVPRFARSTARKEYLKDAVLVSGLVVSEVTAAFKVSWCLVSTILFAAAATLPYLDLLAPTRLVIDDHRYRSVR